MRDPKRTVRARAEEGLGPVVMDRTKRSSHVASVGYDVSTRTLYVEYLKVKPKSGRQPARIKKGSTVIYKYFNVPQYLYTQTLRSPSVGKFLWRRIYGKYRYVMLGRKGWRGPVGGHRAQRRRTTPKIKRK